MVSEEIKACYCVSTDNARECDFGFYFPLALKSGEILAPGVIGVFLDKNSKGIHYVGSGRSIDYSLEAYSRELHKPQNLSVTEVSDINQACKILQSLQLTYVKEEIVSADLYRVQDFYRNRQIRSKLQNLPALFEEVYLFHRLEELKNAEEDESLKFKLEKRK